MVAGTTAEGLEQRLREWRHAHRWTQERLAEALGYDVSYIAKIEQGRRAPTEQFLTRLATVLDVPRDDLIRFHRQPSSRVRLPVPERVLIGRLNEVVDVTTLLRGNERLLTLIGAPGIGKTSLALEVAWELAQSFRHGACFVPLADVADAASVPAAILRRLGLREEPGRDPQDAIGDALRSRQMLLVLDNFEHVLAAASLVQTLAATSTQLRILVTSRQALDVAGERTYAVDPLGFPDPGQENLERADAYPAVALFLERSRSARPDLAITESNIRDVVEICARLDGLPLAITLTAPACRILSPAEIANALRGRLELPTEMPPDPLAHNCLRSALDWSWDLLEPGERMLLASLGVFAGGFTVDAAERVCGEQIKDVLGTIAALESKSLLHVSPSAGDSVSRFTCLDTVRRYVLQRLSTEGAGVEILRRRHFSYFLDLAERAGALLGGDEQARHLRRLDEEFANLQAAFDWAVDRDPQGALCLAASLWRYFSSRRVREGRRWLARAMELNPVESLTSLKALNGFAILAWLQGDLSLAERSAERARDLAIRLDAPHELAFALLNRGITAEARASYDAAEERFQEALSAYSDIDDVRGMTHALNCLGVVALRRDQKRAAASLFLDALARFRSLGDHWSTAVTVTNLGWIAETDGELSEARDWYEESRQTWVALGDEHGVARAVASMGRVERRAGEHARARKLLEQALGIFHGVGDRRLAAACLVELAAIAVHRGRPDLAARLLGASDRVREDVGAPAWPEEAALTEDVRARLLATMGEPSFDRAWRIGRALSLEDAIDMVESDSWPPTRGRRRGFEARGDAFGAVDSSTRSPMTPEFAARGASLTR